MPLPDPHLIPTAALPREQSEFARYVFYAPPGVRPEHVVDPDFWQHRAGQFRVNDVVTAIADDGTFEIEMRVVSLDPRRLWAEMRVLRAWEGKTRTKARTYPDKDGYTVEFNKVHKWRIVDAAGHVVARDMPDEATAEETLAEVKAAKKAAA